MYSRPLTLSTFCSCTWTGHPYPLSEAFLPPSPGAGTDVTVSEHCVQAFGLRLPALPPSFPILAHHTSEPP